MVYLKEFETVSAYETFAASEDFIEPNVSMIGQYGESGFDVKYNKDKPGPTPPHDYSQDYLTLVFLTTGSVESVYYDSIYVSTDKENWTQLNDEMEFAAGDKLYIKGDIKKHGSSDFSYFVFNGMFNVEGNVMSIYDSEGFRTRTTFVNNDDNLITLFQGNTGLISAENLILPVTALTDYCYNYMFRGCTGLTTAPALPATTLATSCYSFMFEDCSSLTTAPELPATTLADWCYEYMFHGCTSLNYIKCLATDISADDCTDDWVYGVSSTGTFVKDDNMTGWTTGTSGIPSGWTVQGAS